MQQMIKN